jgi:chemotaxis protein MotB
MRRRRKAEEHAQHERWLISYADFVTLLFALFVVLFASARNDKENYRELAEAVKNGFRDLGAFHGNTVLSRQKVGTTNQLQFQGTESIDTLRLEALLTKTLAPEIAQHAVVLRRTHDGVVISLRELGFFDSGQATLLPGASDTLTRIAAVLIQSGLDMRVEGHTDDVPIHNAQFNSNWELSTARATAVAMILLKNQGIDPRRLSISGYAEYHPTSSNASAEGRQANRRVDLVLVREADVPRSQ